MGLLLNMICNKKIFNKFLLLSLMFLSITVCCNTLFVSATPLKKDTYIQDPVQNVQVQQRTLIDRLNRIEHKLKKQN